MLISPKVAVAVPCECDSATPINFLFGSVCRYACGSWNM